MLGSQADLAPLARMHRSKEISSVGPSLRSTRIVLLSTNAAWPWMYSIFFCLASMPSPLVILAMTLFFQARTLSISIRGLANSTPHSLRPFGVADHLGHVQKGLGRDAAAIEADAAGIGLLVDQRNLQSEVRRGERRGVSAGPGPEDDQLTCFTACHENRPLQICDFGIVDC